MDLSKEEQRQRIIELVRQKEGQECPELVVEYIEEAIGPETHVFYRCKESDPEKQLVLDDEQATYIGLDRTAPEGPEMNR